MRHVAPDAWFAGIRNKNIYTPEKCDQDRVNLLAYLQNHGFPQARVGAPRVTVVNAFSNPSSAWHFRPVQPGLTVALPIDSGNFYTFGPPEISTPLHERLNALKKGNLLSPDLNPGRPFSERAVETSRREVEIRLHRKVRRQKGTREYRLRATSTFDYATHIATVKFDLDPTPSYTVRRLELRGNQRFPDKYLRRRIPLSEGQPLDEYAIEAGLARVARTGYFLPFKKEDVQIDTHDTTHSADVIIRVHERANSASPSPADANNSAAPWGLPTAFSISYGLDESFPLNSTAARSRCNLP